MGALKAALQVAVLAAVLWLFVFQVSVVSGSSMYPSLEPDDKLVIDKFAYQWRTIRRFDVVVFECPSQAGVDYVKRVVGLPGETLVLEGGRLYVDGRLVDQPFDYMDDGYTCGPVEVPEGSFFVLGDNRPHSRDSRVFRPQAVPKESIKGVARFRVYPFGRAGSL